jgi:hypothetical protein
VTEQPVAAVAAPPRAHDHSWQLVSVESECGGVEVRELICMTCSAVMIDG